MPGPRPSFLLKGPAPIQGVRFTVPEATHWAPDVSSDYSGHCVGGKDRQYMEVFSRHISQQLKCDLNTGMLNTQEPPKPNRDLTH